MLLKSSVEYYIKKLDFIKKKKLISIHKNKIKYVAVCMCLVHSLSEA